MTTGALNAILFSVVLFASVVDVHGQIFGDGGAMDMTEFEFTTPAEQAAKHGGFSAKPRTHSVDTDDSKAEEKQRKEHEKNVEKKEFLRFEQRQALLKLQHSIAARKRAEEQTERDHLEHSTAQTQEGSVRNAYDLDRRHLPAKAPSIHDLHNLPSSWSMPQKNHMDESRKRKAKETDDTERDEMDLPTPVTTPSSHVNHHGSPTPEDKSSKSDPSYGQSDQHIRFDGCQQPPYGVKIPIIPPNDNCIPLCDFNGGWKTPLCQECIFRGLVNGYLQGHKGADGTNFNLFAYEACNAYTKEEISKGVDERPLFPTCLFTHLHTACNVNAKWGHLMNTK